MAYIVLVIAGLAVAALVQLWKWGRVGEWFIEQPRRRSQIPMYPHYRRKY